MRTTAASLLSLVVLLGAAPAFALGPSTDANASPPSTGSVATVRLAGEREFTAPSPQNTRDMALEYRIEEAVGRLAGVDSSALHVRCVRGAALLYGAVPTEQARERAVFAAHAVEGVRVVRDELAIAPARGGGPADDRAIAAQTRAAITRDPGAVSGPLAVEAHQGVVTLRGPVGTYADARRVVRAVRAIDGVRAVRPELTVREGQVYGSAVMLRRNPFATTR